MLADLRSLRRDPADHDHEHDHGESDGREQDNGRGGRPRDPMRRQPPHDRRSDRRHDRRRDDGPHDRLRGTQQPDETGEEEEKSDEEPRRTAEVAQPPRGREDGRELPRLGRAQLDGRRLYGSDHAVPFDQLPEKACAGHCDPMVPLRPEPQHHPEGVM